jgi:hypothetical protein
MGPTPPPKAQLQTFVCAKLRHFGPRMANDEWLSLASRDCQHRANRRDHPYARRNHECLIDAIVEQRRVSPAVEQACRSQPRRTSAHHVMNCLVEALRGDPRPVSVSTTMVHRAADRAQPAPAGGCIVGSLVMDCGCWEREKKLERAEQAERERAARAAGGAAAPVGRSFAQRQADTAACIDRQANADRYRARMEPTARAMPAAIDTDDLLACWHRVIATEMPAVDLLDHGSTRAALSERCKPKLKPR